MASGEVDFLRGIEAIGPGRIENLKYNQILICST